MAAAFHAPVSTLISGSTPNGLSFKCYRLQGRIEGNIQKLRAQREKTFCEKEPTVEKHNRDASLSPSPAPISVKRRRFLNLIDEDDNTESEGDDTVVKREVKRVLKKGPVRKLRDDFERVANDKDRGVPSKGKMSFGDVESEEEPMKRKKGLKKSKVEVHSGTRARTRRNL